MLIVTSYIDKLQNNKFGNFQNRKSMVNYVGFQTLFESTFFALFENVMTEIMLLSEMKIHICNQSEQSE